MQEDLLQPLLTVHEMMLVAANLKLGTELSKANKLIAVSIFNLIRGGIIFLDTFKVFSA